MAAAYQREFGGRPSRSSSPQGRFAQEAAIIDGRALTSAECFGKHLFLGFGDEIVHVHLGMAGKTRLQRAEGGEDLGEEVTDDSRYTNSYLSKNPWPSWPDNAPRGEEKP